MQLTTIACDLAHKILLTDLGEQLFKENSPQFMSKNLNGLIGFKKLEFTEEGTLCFESYVKQLTQLLAPFDGTYIEHNCGLLVQALGGSDNCTKLLYGLVLLQECSEFSGFFNHLVYDDLDSNVLFAGALGLSVSEVLEAVMWLTDTPLFESSAKDISNAQTLHQLISYRLAKAPVDSYLDIITDVIEQMPCSHLTVEQDFEYIDQLDLLSSLLSTATTVETQGINILVYGKPGVGKTEAMKAVADAIDVTLFKVHSNTNALHEHYRKGSVRQEVSYKVKKDYLLLIQQLFHNNQGIALLAEEAEDLFSQGFLRNELSKDSVHGLLETNAIPVVYVTNHIDQVPESCIRRMSMVIEVNTPDNRILKAISDEYLKGFRIRNTFKEKLVAMTGLTPAHIANAAQVIELTGLKGKAAEQHIQGLVEHNLLAMGVKQETNQYQAQTAFKPEYLNIKKSELSYGELLNAIKRGSPIRCLLSGSAGTGKSNLVHQLSFESKQPLLVKKASDILDKYVGGTEQNIAQAFQEASDNNQMLFIDELDSLLYNRESASQPWQVSQVNELLVQLEQFNQPFFAATNFDERIDKAALRRFDVKLMFDYLKPEQVLGLFCDTLNIKQASLSEQTVNQLTQLNMLTPGEFAILARRQRLFNKTLTTEQAVSLLHLESDTKRPSAAIGFVH